MMMMMMIQFISSYLPIGFLQIFRISSPDADSSQACIKLHCKQGFPTAKFIL